MWACRYAYINFAQKMIYNLFRVEDLAAAVPNVPELPPMEILM